MRVAVVVLAGGGSRRWEGRDKTAVLLGSRTVLEHAVEGLRSGVSDAGHDVIGVVVAGPPDHPARPALGGVRWVREEPPGGGPVAGLAAALAGLGTDVDVVVAGAGDAPFGRRAVPRLLLAVADLSTEGCARDGAVAVDPDRRRQPLLAAYRVAPVRAALAALGDPAGVSLRAVLARLRLVDVPVSACEALDLDVPATLDRARALLGCEDPGAAPGYDDAAS